MRRAALLLVGAALLSLGAPAAQAGPLDCLRPPFINTKDLPGTVSSVVEGCF
jgi:hypothetical protein